MVRVSFVSFTDKPELTGEFTDAAEAIKLLKRGLVRNMNEAETRAEHLDSVLKRERVQARERKPDSVEPDASGRTVRNHRRK